MIGVNYIKLIFLNTIKNYILKKIGIKRLKGCIYTC